MSSAGLVVLAGCASVPGLEAPASAPLPTLAHSGRLALRVDASAEREAQALTADFELRGDARRGQLDLSTPVGTQLAQARWTPDGVWLQTPQGTQRYSDLDTLARQALGEALPLAALPDWLAGRPSPLLPAPASAGLRFQQGEWQVDATQRTEGRIDILRERPPAVRLRFRLDNPAS